ncbi:hypothetical protein K402DRAFT_390743 [Aulographum hederae CBS 113979]|uniref:Uncharacterized protein n=1 Tax=Aulographum hederae CBS 113979 TaxID=1176131 RepID=A0A6G1H9C9_9PEZI|nr:hypothetical protein K402DRAFT_390743 [Aulographum hederae CBS 113979]
MTTFLDNFVDLKVDVRNGKWKVDAGLELARSEFCRSYLIYCSQLEDGSDWGWRYYMDLQSSDEQSPPPTDFYTFLQMATSHQGTCPKPDYLTKRFGFPVMEGMCR